MQGHACIGNTISQQGSNATGKLVSTAGIATGSLTVSRVGLVTPAKEQRFNCIALQHDR